MNKLEVLEPFGPRIAKVKLSKELNKEKEIILKMY